MDDNKWFRKRKGLKSKDLGFGYMPVNWKGTVAIIMTFSLILVPALFVASSDTQLVEGLLYLIYIFAVLIGFKYFADPKTRQ